MENGDVMEMELAEEHLVVKCPQPIAQTTAIGPRHDRIAFYRTLQTH